MCFYRRKCITAVHLLNTRALTDGISETLSLDPQILKAQQIIKIIIDLSKKKIYSIHSLRFTLTFDHLERYCNLI